MEKSYLNKIVSKFLSRVNTVREVHLKKNAIENLFDNYEMHDEEEKRILVWTAPGGMAPIIEIDSIIATALRLRNAKLRFLLCDGAPVACIMREIDINDKPATWKDYCKFCFKSAQQRLKPFGLQYYRIGEFLNNYSQQFIHKLVDDIQINDLENFYYENVDIGRLAIASTLRYSKGKQLDNYDDILRRYIFSGLVNLNAAKHAIDAFSPDYLLMSHGTYVDWGVAFKYGLLRNIPSVIWNSAYEKNHFFFRHETKDFAKHRIERIGCNSWKINSATPLARKERFELFEYIKKRYNSNEIRTNTKDSRLIVKASSEIKAEVKQFDTLLLPPPMYSPSELRKKLNIDNNKPTWALFTHVLWEGVYNYGPIMFKDETSWLLQTMEAMQRVEDVNWLIRIHPGEMQYPGSKSALETIQKSYPRLPDQIKIITPDQNINTLDILHLINGGITIFGTVGLELAIQGKPVILCGKGFYGNKGFTYDCNNEHEFSNLLRKVGRLPPLSEEQVQLARKYAHVFFLKSQLPIPCLKGKSERFGWSLDIDKVDLLKPNGNHCIDLICRAILERNDFILDDATKCSL